MPEFVTVTHPDLPGQTARMANPRNGWVPATKETLASGLEHLTKDELDERGRSEHVDLTGTKTKADKIRAISTSALAEQDSPTAGPSTTPEKE